MPTTHEGVMPRTHEGVMPTTHEGVMPKTHEGVMPTTHEGVMPKGLIKSTQEEDDDDDDDDKWELNKIEKFNKEGMQSQELSIVRSILHNNHNGRL